MTVFIVYVLACMVALPVVFFVILNLVTRGERKKGCLTFLAFGFVVGLINGVMMRVLGPIVGAWGLEVAGFCVYFVVLKWIYKIRWIQALLVETILRIVYFILLIVGILLVPQELIDSFRDHVASEITQDPRLVEAMEASTELKLFNGVRAMFKPSKTDSKPKPKSASKKKPAPAPKKKTMEPVKSTVNWDEPPDILELVNGSTLEGKIISDTPASVTVIVEGTTLTMPRNRIRNITYGKSTLQKPEAQPTNQPPEPAP